MVSHIGNRRFLSVETDAAINPGNSGGPVLQDDRVVGVAFQGIPGLQNAGFFIPTPVIEHFLKDIEDGHYDGFPQAGVRLEPLQNPAYRAFLKLPDNDQGEYYLTDVVAILSRAGARVEAVTVADASEALGFLETAGAVRLVKAYAQIDDTDVRRALVDLAESIASGKV